MDLNYFFDQYLHQPSLPELDLQWKQDKTNLILHYKWNNTVSGFHMPVKVTTSKDHFDFIYPTTQWQSLKIGNMEIKDLRVAKNEFYIEQKMERARD